MPIYEYKCEACGHQLETLQKVSEAPLKKCPECGKPALRKLISATGFRLKGSGWYETDFKSGNKHNVLDSGDKPAKEGKDKKPAEPGAKKDKVEKKPEAKTTAKPENKKTASSGSS
ncbi:MAG: FmdB family zinc ribbon protein [Gammaproteobacteria bacterium]